MKIGILLKVNDAHFSICAEEKKIGFFRLQSKLK